MKYVAKTRILGARQFRPKDARDVASWMSVTPEGLFMVSSSLKFPVTSKALVKRFTAARSGEHAFYSVFLLETGEHVGHFEIKNISARHRSGTGAHIILAPSWRGRGLGKDLARLVSGTAFGVLKLYRVGLSVHTVNKPAIAAYKKAGYAVEGVIREVLNFGGKRYSLYQMSILRPEWEKRKRC
ncbi:MAG: GNAT family protein [Candidatus Omnitrophota bacterium]